MRAEFLKLPPIVSSQRGWFDRESVCVQPQTNAAKLQIVHEFHRGQRHDDAIRQFSQP